MPGLSRPVRAAAAARILRRHLPQTITQGEGNAVLIDCTCGAEVAGVMPADADITTAGALLYVMADHIGGVMAR